MLSARQTLEPKLCVWILQHRSVVEELRTKGLYASAVAADADADAQQQLLALWRIG
jgi:hypothetical protein